MAMIFDVWFAFISAKFNYVLSHVLHISGGTTWLAEVTLQGRPLRLISSVNILQAAPIRRCSWSPDLHIWREKILWSGEYLSIANTESRIPAVSSHCEVVRRVGQGEFREIELGLAGVTAMQFTCSAHALSDWSPHSQLSRTKIAICVIKVNSIWAMLLENCKSWVGGQTKSCLVWRHVTLLVPAIAYWTGCHSL